MAFRGILALGSAALASAISSLEKAPMCPEYRVHWSVLLQSLRWHQVAGRGRAVDSASVAYQ